LSAISPLLVAILLDLDATSAIENTNACDARLRIDRDGQVCYFSSSASIRIDFRAAGMIRERRATMDEH